MGLGGVGVPGRRVTDVAAHDHQARAPGLGHGLPEAGLERVEVVGDLTELHDVPAVARETVGDVVAVRQLGGAVDRDVVVVVDVDEAAEAEVTGDRRRLVAHALLQVAVAAEGEDVVVDHLLTEAGAEVGLGQRDADAVGEPLAERTGGDLDAGRVAVLRVPRGLRAPLAEVLQVVEGQPEPGEVEERVEEHRRVPVRQHETVAVGPVRGGSVVLHDPGPQDVGQRRQGHGCARVPRVRRLHRVHGQATDHVDAALLDVPGVDLGRRHCALSVPVPVSPRVPTPDPRSDRPKPTASGGDSSRGTSTTAP